jgi:uncharacterized protein YbjQ (UPF0145 family)
VLVVTMDGLPGYEVRHVIGEVIASLPRTRNAFAEGVKSLRGGAAHPQAADHLYRWRAEALAKLGEAAQQMGANAVLAMRFEHREVGTMWMEMCAYGTAVVVARVISEGGDRREYVPPAEPPAPIPPPSEGVVTPVEGE